MLAAATAAIGAGSVFAVKTVLPQQAASMAASVRALGERAATFRLSDLNPVRSIYEGVKSKITSSNPGEGIQSQIFVDAAVHVQRSDQIAGADRDRPKGGQPRDRGGHQRTGQAELSALAGDDPVQPQSDRLARRSAALKASAPKASLDDAQYAIGPFANAR
jgi:hypothetical protein